MLTPQRLLRAAIDRELGGPGITAAQRMADALQARRCRNLFFRATAPPIVNSAASNNVQVRATTLTYGLPIILTDILNYNGLLIDGQYWHGPNFLVEIFSSVGAGIEDFFGSTSPTDVIQTLSHWRNNFHVPVGLSPPVPFEVDSPSNKCHFMPYMMNVGQTFNINWTVPSANTTQTINCAADFRGVTVLPSGDVYGQLCGRLKEQVCDYIARRDIETFILDINVDTALFTAQGQTIDFTTQPQERPLLLLGMSTNLNGLQCQMRDITTRWQFDLPFSIPSQCINVGAPDQYLGPVLQGLPLYVFAANPELTNRDAYNMLPVPHLLEPNSSFLFKLTNGLRPDALANTFQQVVNTQGQYNDGGGAGKISLLFRTV